MELNRRTFLRVGALGAVWLGMGPDLMAADPFESLKVLSTDPPNAEPHLADLVRDWITPVEHFYVRSHAVAPKLDPGTFKVSVEGLVQRPMQFTLGELTGKLQPRTVTATMTCAGNRRNEHSKIKKIDGVPWGEGAIGNANWTGIRLADLLKKAGIRESAKHIWFEGADRIPKGGDVITFGGSIPLEKALEDATPALVAYEMNGKPLTADHGFPLRTVVPGYIGARSVKWLRRIVVSDRPSPNHYLQGAYKLVEEETPEFLAKAPPIYEYILNSAICVPASGSKVDSPVDVRGYVLGPGDPHVTVAKVEVSADGGKSWTQAKLLGKEMPYCWRLWQVNIDLPEGSTELIVRATDSQGNQQPQTVPWNVKGYMYNAWHHVPVTTG